MTGALCPFLLLEYCCQWFLFRFSIGSKKSLFQLVGLKQCHWWMPLIIPTTCLTHPLDAMMAMCMRTFSNGRRDLP